MVALQAKRTQIHSQCSGKPLESRKGFAAAVPHHFNPIFQDLVAQFVSKLKTEGVFAKEVLSAGVAFHSYYMASIAPVLLSALQKVIISLRGFSLRGGVIKEAMPCLGGDL